MKKVKHFFVMLIASIVLLNFCNRTLAQSYPEMIKVAGGTFIMGDGSMGNPDELPTHSVTLKSFSMAKTETTVAQWQTYCNATGKQMPEAPSWRWNDNDPIVNVNWEDAVAYCDWLTHKTGHLYRLPTEAEYEYAARGGNNSKGFKYSGAQSLDVSGWYNENSGGYPHTVATKKPNELGLYDMSGNVFEWCNDWYAANYYANSPGTNPQGAAPGQYRVLRGGSWNLGSAYSRVAYRSNRAPAYRYDFMGFRVASTL